jgi:hypothetical protein
VQVAAFAQAILLPKDEILPKLTDLKVENELAFYVNGPLTYGLSEAEQKQYYNLAGLSRIMLSAVTLRLIDQGKLSLDDQAPVLIPDILEEIPFRRIITIRDLLSGTAGFAVPPWYTAGDYPKEIITDTFEPYIIQARGAGQIRHDDPVGWAILTKILERVTDQSLEELVTAEIIEPTGLASNEIHFSQSPSIFSPVFDIEASGNFIAELARLLIRNRSINGRFLTPETYKLFTEIPSWKLHPLAPKQILTLQQSFANDSAMLMFNQQAPKQYRSEQYRQGWSLVAFPAQGSAFVAKGVNATQLTDLTTEIANQYFPKGEGNPEQHLAEKLREPKLLNGIYVKEQYPTVSLKNRLNNILNATVTINRLNDGNLSLQTVGSTNGGDASFFRKDAPYHYTNLSNEQDTLIFSPVHAGGYFILGGETYRHVGLIGDKALVITPISWLFTLLLSAIIYWPQKLRNTPLAIQIRRMGMFSVAGVILLGAGIFCELLFWTKAVYIWDTPILVFIWRFALNIGLMAILTVPMFTLSITKRKLIPTGVLGAFINLHIVFLTAASLLVFFIMVAWGIAGEFWAY